MAFTCGVNFYERALGACHRLDLTQLTGEITRQNYLKFRMAIARMLTSTIDASCHTKGFIASTCGMAQNRLSNLLSGSLLIRPTELDTMLALLETQPSEFWGAVHTLIRAPAFFDSISAYLLPSLTLKHRIACIVARDDRSLQDIADAHGISKASLARATSHMLPRLSSSPLERILQALEGEIK